MAKSLQKIIKKYQKYTGIKKLTAISCGRIITIYQSKIIYNQKLLTRNFKTHELAKNHLTYVLIADGKTVKNNNFKLYQKPKRTYENSPFKFYPISISA
jgi:hypothetical protein